MSTKDEERYEGEGIPEDPSEDECAYYRPRPGPQVWLIIAVAVVIVGIAVLFVYQTGDKKTILTKQPLVPAAAPLGPSTGFAQNCPSGGSCFGAPGAPSAAAPLAAQNCPTGGGCVGPTARGGSNLGRAVGAALPAAAVAPMGSSVAAQPAVCPRCGNQAVPLCSRCNSIMQPLDNGLFYCPRCGNVGTVLCPYCNARMGTGTTAPGAPTVATVAAATTGNPPTSGAGGQFVCPSCNATGLPNWTPMGATLCPNCGGGMSTRTAVTP